MAIILTHFSATAQQHCEVAIPSLAPHGYMAVDLFFVLSGFIMSYTYLAPFQANGFAAFPTFLGKRLARIMPLNVAVLLILVLSAFVSQAVLGRNIFFDSKNLPYDLTVNLLMLQGLGVGMNLNGPSWSISTEFAAYLIFPILIVFMFHRRAVVWLGALAVAVALLCWEESLRRSLGLGGFSQGVIRCFSEFVMGMGSYRLYRNRRYSAWLGQDFVTFALVFACVALLVLGVDLAVALLFPFLLVAFACNDGRASRLMCARVPYFLGVVSFSLYLIHNMFRPLEAELLHALYPHPLNAPMALLFAVLGSLSVIPFAWVTYRTIEKPGRLMVQRSIAAAKAVRA